jgi:hypothetical protein
LVKEPVSDHMWQPSASLCSHLPEWLYTRYLADGSFASRLYLGGGEGEGN